MSKKENAVYLGRAVACTRLERGMKRKDLVKAAGISYPFLAEIENGKKSPSLATLDSVAAALRTTSLDLPARAKQIGDDFPVLQEATGAYSRMLEQRTAEIMRRRQAEVTS
jgi:transcriptional regulator with XRE-family HTH domain